jgi:ASC-1-like (ASCH) protein
MAKKEKDKLIDSGETIFHISASQALKVAEMQIEKYRRLKEWRDAYAVKVFPLFSRLDKEKSSYFEVKISTPSNDDAGTVIISATDRDFPIIGFRTHGRTLSEKVISRSDYDVKRIIWHGSDAVTGENEAGKEIVSIGRKQTLVFDLEEYEKFRRKRKENPLPKPLPEPKKSEELQEEWKEVKKALGSIKSNPYGVTADSFNFAWGWSRHANLEQYDLPNDKSVGCAATAWTALLAYHDMHWDPDLLYGTHDNMSDYIKRSMKVFHDATDTDEFSGYINTWAWNMKNGFDVFKEYHCFGNLDFHPDDYAEWDWDVILLGTEPSEPIQDLILDMISRDTPVLIGLKSGKSGKSKWVGHYCLGLAWAKNDKGKLKFVLCDELHGNGEDDLYWWHREAIFGAWGIPQGAHDHPRWKSDIGVWRDVSLSNLGNEIYAVGRNIPETSQTPPLFLIKRGPATGFPIPVKGTNPKKLEFDESIEIPVYELQESEFDFTNPSITTWNNKDRLVLDYLKETRLLPANFKASNVDFTREDIANILLKPDIQEAQISIFETIDVPYLFLAWATYPGRIHIAYAIIPENLQELSFKHVLLPERFNPQLFEEIPIAIAKQDRTDPMLYIAYKDNNLYPDVNPMASYGRLVIINLDLFFQIAETGEDLWPQDTVPNLTYTQEEYNWAGVTRQHDVLTDFKWHWPRLRLAGYTRNLKLSSNGKEVLLIWGGGGMSGGGHFWTSEPYIIQSHTFENEVENEVENHLIVNFPIYPLKIPYAYHGVRFLHHVQYEETEGEYSIGRLEAIQYDILYCEAFGFLIVWNNPDYRLLIAKVNSQGRADLLADLFTSGYSPSLAFIKDELDNRNIVLTFYKSRVLYSLILFLSGIGRTGITDFDDLPK